MSEPIVPEVVEAEEEQLTSDEAAEHPMVVSIEVTPEEQRAILAALKRLGLIN